MLIHPIFGAEDPILADNNGNELPPAWYNLIATSQHITLIDNGVH